MQNSHKGLENQFPDFSPQHIVKPSAKKYLKKILTSEKQEHKSFLSLKG